MALRFWSAARKWLSGSSSLPQLSLLSACLSDPRLSPPGRALLYRLREGLGSVPRASVSAEVDALRSSDRSRLFRLGIKLGVHTVYSAPLLKPAMLARRAWLWSLHSGQQPLRSGPSGAASVPLEASPAFYTAVGYSGLGDRAVRVDMVERLDACLRAETRRGAAPLPTAPMSWLGCSRDSLAEICRGLGYTIRGEGEEQQVSRPRRRYRPRRR